MNGFSEGVISGRTTGSGAKRPRRQRVHLRKNIIGRFLDRALSRIHPVFVSTGAPPVLVERRTSGRVDMVAGPSHAPASRTTHRHGTTIGETAVMIHRWGRPRSISVSHSIAAGGSSTGQVWCWLCQLAGRPRIRLWDGSLASAADRWTDIDKRKGRLNDDVTQHMVRTGGTRLRRGGVRRPRPCRRRSLQPSRRRRRGKSSSRRWEQP